MLNAWITYNPAGHVDVVIEDCLLEDDDLPLVAKQFATPEDARRYMLAYWPECLLVNDYTRAELAA